MDSEEFLLPFLRTKNLTYRGHKKIEHEIFE